MSTPVKMDFGDKMMFGMKYEFLLDLGEKVFRLHYPITEVMDDSVIVSVNDLDTLYDEVNLTILHGGMEYNLDIPMIYFTDVDYRRRYDESFINRNEIMRNKMKG